MLTLNDVINVSSRKSNFSGYRIEDVDAFIDQVEDSYGQLLKKMMEQAEVYETLANEKKELEKKPFVLAEKTEDYRQEESEVKTALTNAQKLGKSSVREACHKVGIILKDMNLKAERILDTVRADVVEQQCELDELKKKVIKFRTKLPVIYKEHLTLIDAIPSRKEEFTQEGSHVAAEPEREQEEPERQSHHIPEEPPVPAEPEPEYTPEPGKDDFSVDATVFDTESLNHNLRYSVLEFGEVGESGEE